MASGRKSMKDNQTDAALVGLAATLQNKALAVQLNTSELCRYTDTLYDEIAKLADSMAIIARQASRCD